MAKYTSRDGQFSSDDPNAVNEYNNGAGAKTPTAPGSATDTPGGLGASFGGNPGTAVPGHNGLTIGPDGQVHDLNQVMGGTGTALNLNNPNIYKSNIGDAVGLDNIGNKVTNDPTVNRDGMNTQAGQGNVNVGNAPLAQPNGSNYTQSNTGAANTTTGTLVPGVANVSDLTSRDPRDYQYGRTPTYARDVVGQARTQAGAFGNEMRGLGADAAATGDQYATQTAGAGQRGQEVGAGVQRDLSAEGALAAARGGQLGAGLNGLEATQGPSAAQAQLQSATSQGMNDALTMARSGRGMGGSAATTAQATRAMPGMAASAANQSATLRANEDALWRARQAQNMTNAAGIEQRGLDQQMSATGAGGQAAMAGTAQGIQGSQAGGQLALAGRGQQQSAVGAGQGQFWQGESLADTVTGRQMAQDQNYENMLTQEKGINAGIAINAANNQQSIWPAVIGAGATGLAMAASDERNKDIMGPVKMDDEVKLSSAIHGNPYGRTGAPGKDFASSPQMKGPKSDLSPYGSGPMGGYQNYAAAQGTDQKLAAQHDRESEARLQAAIQRLGGIAQGVMTPRQNNGAAGQAMVDRAMSMQPVVSDENSKNKISDLESQLAAARQGLSGPAATTGAQRGDVDTAALDAARGRAGAPDFTQSPNYAYTYKDPTIPGAKPGVQVGPMAQDLERAGSQAVVDTPTGKMVDPGRVAMETAGAVGEVQGRTDDLERQFAELEAMLRSDKKTRPQASAR